MHKRKSEIWRGNQKALDVAGLSLFKEQARTNSPDLPRHILIFGYALTFYNQ
jgi:hypothetical protein